jgi:gentisate 1,2-dioxygenase
LGDDVQTVGKGDLIVVPSWVQWSILADTDLDLFVFSDAPIFERLQFGRTLVSRNA